VAAARERWTTEVARVDAEGRTAITRLHATFGAAFASAADAGALLAEADRLKAAAQRQRDDAAAERDRCVRAHRAVAIARP